MSGDRTGTPPPASEQRPSGEPAPARAPYEPPTITDYGDIATITQSGGISVKDTGQRRTRL